MTEHPTGHSRIFTMLNIAEHFLSLLQSHSLPVFIMKNMHFSQLISLLVWNPYIRKSTSKCSKIFKYRTMSFKYLGYKMNLSVTCASQIVFWAFDPCL